MSSGKRPRAWADAMLDAAWAWAAEVGTEHSLGVQVSLTPLRRRECWLVSVRALEMVDGKPKAVHAHVVEEWPTAHYESLTATVLRLTSRLERELAIDPLRRESGSA